MMDERSPRMKQGINCGSIKALQAHSKAVKNAIAKYNEIAESMTQPKPTLNWEEVMEYAFLSDFDLLHEGQEDIRGELWAQPASSHGSALQAAPRG
jgi:hypothetical protein